MPSSSGAMVVEVVQVPSWILIALTSAMVASSITQMALAALDWWKRRAEEYARVMWVPGIHSWEETRRERRSRLTAQLWNTGKVPITLKEAGLKATQREAGGYSLMYYTGIDKGRSVPETWPATIGPREAVKLDWTLSKQDSETAATTPHFFWALDHLGNLYVSPLFTVEIKVAAGIPQENFTFVDETEEWNLGLDRGERSRAKRRTRELRARKKEGL